MSTPTSPSPAGRSRAARIVGIDLGTTHTVVAWADPAAGERAGRIFPIPQLVTPAEIEARPLLGSFLYAPVEAERVADPFGDAPFVIGELARRRGGEVPGRLVASSKSWLCHPGVDRTAPILPWGAPEELPDLPRISPLTAATRVLAHVRRTWDEAFPEHPLAAQDVILTVPASFDEVARELTLEAARRAGLAVRLLEEPQAAFYDYMQSAGERGIEALVERAGGEALVLVCDVGGGTTDLSLIRVARAEGARPFEVSRVAVGHHLLLGGDNMDLALAHLCEGRLVQEGRLDPARFGQLVLACRAAKERLLGGGDGDGDGGGEIPDEMAVTLVGSGSRLVGGTLTTRLGREETERIVLDGFFPETPRDARPQRTRSALVAFGLPYEKDVAVTRHVAWFFARHAPEAKGPSALLLNGGVFRAPRIAERLSRAIDAWGGPPLDVLPHADPDLAVASGAVAYGLALAGIGARIESGAARGYYVGLDAPGAGGRRRAACVVPRGAKEGTVHAAAGKTFALVVGRPVRFDLFASDDARVDRAGDVVEIDEDRFEALPPVATVLDAGGAGAPRAMAKGAEVRVQLEGELTAIGTLDLACVEVAGAAPAADTGAGAGAAAGRRFRLAFQLRGGSAADTGESAEARAGRGGATPGGRRLDEAREAIERVFGKGRPDVAPREVKGLVRELERILGERSSWSADVNRALFDTLIPSARSRRRSADHERVFWSIAGYCLRPGFGAPGDPARTGALWPLFVERLAFPNEARGYQQFWIAWRRVAGGLDEAAQIAIRDATDPLIAPPEARLKKPKGLRPEALDDLLELSASLERVPPARRSELGGWILEKTWTSRDPRLWAAIGRIGARAPAYASVHHVVSPIVAERWIDHLLREKWHDLPTAPGAAAQLARLTGDRARDVSERTRGEVERRLVKAGAREEWIRAVRELVLVEDSDRAAFFGEGLPSGLRLVEG